MKSRDFHYADFTVISHFTLLPRFAQVTVLTILNLRLFARKPLLLFLALKM